MPLSTGSAYHLGVAAILLSEHPEFSAMTEDSIRQTFRPLIGQVVDDYVESASKSGLLEVAGEDAYHDSLSSSRSSRWSRRTSYR
jgi:hypothetical protein